MDRDIAQNLYDVSPVTRDQKGHHPGRMGDSLK